MAGKLRTVVPVLALPLLIGVMAGAGLTLYDLSEFSMVPGIVALVFPVLAGGFIGALTPHLSQALGSLLVVILISIIVSTLLLAYAQSQTPRSGLAIGFELSITKALLSAILMVPLTIVGLLLGKFIARNE